MSKYESDTEHRPVKLEDLLRMKRGERPDEAFWGRFDRELHQRMLQSLMKKEPWPLQVARALRVRFVQGATVAAAAAFLLLFAVRPAFFNASPSPSASEELRAAVASAPVEQAAFEAFISRDRLGSMARDFGADEIIRVDDKADYTRDFQPEAIALAVYEQSAYSPDQAFGGLGNDGSALAAVIY